MPIPGFLKNIFTGGASELISKVGGIVDNLTLSKEEKEKFNAALLSETNRHMEAVAELAQAEIDLYLKNTESARQLQIAALNQQDKFAKRFIYYLTSGLCFVTLAFDFAFFFVSYPERNHDTITMIAGTLNGGCLISIMNFYFGSTKGSEKKTDALERMAAK